MNKLIKISDIHYIIDDFTDESDPIVIASSTKELLSIWKEQQLKTIYYV